LCSNSCTSLQTAAAVLKRSPETSPHRTRRHSPTASNVPDIFHISDRLCSNSCLILQTAAAAACQSALIRDIFHISDRLCSNSCLILQTAAAAAYHSALIREIFHIGNRLGSTLARDFNLQLLLPPTQVSFKKYSTLAKECAQTLA
jgi:hypothetical protein